MKKLMFIALIGSISFVTQAQKLMTRTGQVSFFSSTPVENIEAVNNEMASIIDIKTGDVVFVVPIKSFRFDKALMQEHFNENYMESDQYPKADFKGKITNLNEVNFSKEGTYNVKVAGKLTMHGVVQDVTIPGTIIIKNGGATAKTKFMIKPADYKIKIPSVVASKIADQIEVTVNAILSQK